MKSGNALAYSLLMIFALAASPATAQTTVKSSKFENEKRMKTVGGTLASREKPSKEDILYDVLLKDTVITTVKGGVFGPSFAYKFSRKGSDIVLLSVSEGGDCEVDYALLAVTPDGKTTSTKFLGNCREMISLTHDDNKVTLTFPPESMGGRPSKGKKNEVWEWDYSSSSAVKQK